MRYRYLLICFLILIYTLPLQAQDQADDLKDWWKASSLSFDPVPERLLFHIEGQISFTRMSGNVDGHLWSGGAGWALRKRIFTNYIHYRIDRQDIDLEGNRGSVTTEAQKVDAEGRMDLSPRIFVSGGVTWERDDPKFLERRWVYYGGFGYHLSKQEENRVRLFAAAGQQRDRHSGNPQKMHNVMYLALSSSWQIDEHVRFDQDLTALADFNDTDFYWWDLELELVFEITGSISVPISFVGKYNNQPIQQARKLDTQQTVSLRFEF